MNYIIKQLPVGERPREKAINRGLDNLSDAELLAIMLKTGSKSKNVLEVAYELLNKYGNLDNIAKASLGQLQEVKGVGKVKALELLCAFELGKRRGTKERLRIYSGKDIYNLFYSKLAFAVQEELHVVFLDNRKNIIGKKMLFKGTANQSSVHPRDILREALKEGALGIILVHNHPSGDVEPSKNDKELTKEIYLQGKKLGIQVIDHIIVGYNNYYSFYDNNWWDEYERESKK